MSSTLIYLAGQGTISRYQDMEGSTLDEEEPLFELGDQQESLSLPRMALHADLDVPYLVSFMFAADGLFPAAIAKKIAKDGRTDPPSSEPQK